MRRFGTIAVSVGSVLLATGLFAMLLSRREQRRLQGLGLDPRIDPKRRRGLKKMSSSVEGDKTLTHYYHPTMPIAQRVSVLQDLVWKGVKNPEMRKLALAITGCGTRTIKLGGHVERVRGACCRERDGKCEARAVYDYVKSRVRYNGDVAPVRLPDGSVEGIDLFQAPNRTLEIGSGDCDDSAVLSATLLSLNGITAQFRVTKSGRFGGDFSHIYTVAGLPKGLDEKWLAIDTTVPGEFFGREAPYGGKKDFPA